MRTSFFVVVLLFGCLNAANANEKQQNRIKNCTTKSESSQKINLNSANIFELRGSFRGIGKKRAEAIVHYRETHGRFQSVAQLSNIRGISANFVSRCLPELEAVYSVE